METGILAMPPADLQFDEIRTISLSTDLQRQYYERWDYWVEHITIKAHMGLFDPELMELCSPPKKAKRTVTETARSRFHLQRFKAA